MTADSLSFFEKLHYCHRFWRYKRRTEPDTVSFIREEFKPGGFALDIGANKGIVTWFLGKQAGPEGRVMAFEPQPEMQQQIGRVANAFGLENIEIHNFALSNSNEKATLFRGATANLKAGAQWQTDEVEVATKTLDSFFVASGIDHVDFIKCDVDGFETQVIEGAEWVLTTIGPKFLVEIGESQLPEVTDMLKKYGYDGGVFLHKGKRYPASKTAEVGYRHAESKWRNFLFTKCG